MEEIRIDPEQTTDRTRQRGRGSLILSVVAAAAVLLTAAAVLTLDFASRDDPIGQIVRLSVTLAIPAGVVIGYWFIARNQVRAARTPDEASNDAALDVVSRVSHQLRDRLTVIYGFSETLLDSDLNDETEVRDVVTVINTEAVDLGRIVDDLVSATELEAGDIEVASNRFDPSIEIERVVSTFRRAGNEISVDCWTGVAVSDPVRFRQIMRSLVANAVQHGGSQIAVVGEPVEGSFRCTVADDGEGISTALEERLFGLSGAPASLAGRAAGPGFGLTVARAIAQQLGGDLAYEQTDDLAMVTLILPTEHWPEIPRPVIPLDAPDGDSDLSENEDDPEPVDSDGEMESNGVWRVSFDTPNDDPAIATSEPEISVEEQVTASHEPAHQPEIAVPALEESTTQS